MIDKIFTFLGQFIQNKLLDSFETENLIYFLLDVHATLKYRD